MTDFWILLQNIFNKFSAGKSLMALGKAGSRQGLVVMGGD